MDKTFQDIKIVMDEPTRRNSEEIFTLREIRIMEMIKSPNYLILRFNTTTPAIKELIIPILPYMKLIIE